MALCQWYLGASFGCPLPPSSPEDQWGTVGCSKPLNARCKGGRSRAITGRWGLQQRGCSLLGVLTALGGSGRVVQYPDRLRRIASPVGLCIHFVTRNGIMLFLRSVTSECCGCSMREVDEATKATLSDHYRAFLLCGLGDTAGRQTVA